MEWLSRFVSLLDDFSYIHREQWYVVKNQNHLELYQCNAHSNSSESTMNWENVAKIIYFEKKCHCSDKSNEISYNCIHTLSLEGVDDV